jgi:hypothetical protein
MFVCILAPRFSLKVMASEYVFIRPKLLVMRNPHSLFLGYPNICARGYVRFEK